jgi:hypothetical protein
MATGQLLHTYVTGNGIRLELGAWSYGNGRTVEEAADDLVARLRGHATALWRGGFRMTSEMPRIEPEFLAFLWELGDMESRGQDIRERVFRADAP